MHLHIFLFHSSRICAQLISSLWVNSMTIFVRKLVSTWFTFGKQVYMKLYVQIQVTETRFCISDIFPCLSRLTDCFSNVVNKDLSYKTLIKLVYLYYIYLEWKRICTALRPLKEKRRRKKTSWKNYNCSMQNSGTVRLVNRPFLWAYLWWF